jgi:uncharacterized membrane protein
MVRTSTLPTILVVFAVLLTGPFAAPAEAQDKSFELPRAEVVADVEPDGSVLVTEDITYLFSGSFEGGYREIPLKDGMSVSDVSVSEGGKEYAPGASAELGSSGAPGTYGTANLGDSYRIVWHYRASYEERTFTVRYRLEDLAVAHDDVVDLYWQAWGDEWQEPLGSLEATMVLPGDPKKGEVKVFGHPASVSGETSLGPDKVSPTLIASDVPASQFVEMRVVFPRKLLTSTGGAMVEPGDRLKEIMDQEAAEARSAARQAWFLRTAHERSASGNRGDHLPEALGGKQGVHRNPFRPDPAWLPKGAAGLGKEGGPLGREDHDRPARGARLGRFGLARNLRAQRSQGGQTCALLWLGQPDGLPGAHKVRR